MMKIRTLALAVSFAAALFTSHVHAQGAGQLGAGQVWGNPTASAGRGIPSNISAILDQALGSTRGAILERGLSGWGIVAPNATAGLAYASNGTGADPSYQIVPVVGGGTGANTASGARTNLGLAIGTNVEAWDNDLDCLAALATTGVIHRTGTGTCTAATVALSDLIAGTSDTVLGYFGSTAVSANAIPNCTGALVYSTSTHLFTCNATAGTGTVTQVVCGTGLAGGTITTTGTCSLSPIYVNVALTTASVAVSGTVATKIPFNNVIFNVGSYYSTTNHNFQPAVGGTYEVCAYVRLSGTLLQNGVVTLDIFKNVSSTQAEFLLGPAAPAGGNNTGGSGSIGGCTLVSLNGSTDTLEADVSAPTASFTSPIMDNNNSRTAMIIKYVGP